MKKFVMGLIVGTFITISGTVFADEGLQKVEAYLRPTLPITMDGQPITLENAPVMYDGSTYLKLRDVAKLTGLQVNWNDTTQTVELGTSGAVTSKEQGASTVTTTTYDYTQDPVYIRGQKIIELQKQKQDIETNQMPPLSDIVIKHEHDKLWNKDLPDDDQYLQAQQKFTDLQNQLKDINTQLQQLLDEQNKVTSQP